MVAEIETSNNGWYSLKQPSIRNENIILTVLVKMPRVSNMQFENIGETTGQASWEMNDTDESFASVAYYVVAYGTHAENMQEQTVQGKSK